MQRTELGVDLLNGADIISARDAGRKLARAAGFSVAAQTRIATAISEIARIALQYGGRGRCVLTRQIIEGRQQIGVEIVDQRAEDPQANAAEELEAVAELAATRRLFSNLEVQSRLGQTRITFHLTQPRILPRPAPAASDHCAGRAAADSVCSLRAAGTTCLTLVGGLKCRVRTAADVMAARSMASSICRTLELRQVATAQVATAVTELGNNLIMHTPDGGHIRCRLVDSDRAGIEIIASDDGPGIEDLAAALTDGYSTLCGLGSGLPSVRRMMDEFEIASSDAGTTIRARKWLSPMASARPSHACPAARAAR